MIVVFNFGFNISGYFEFNVISFEQVVHNAKLIDINAHVFLYWFVLSVWSIIVHIVVIVIVM